MNKIKFKIDTFKQNRIKKATNTVEIEKQLPKKLDQALVLPKVINLNPRSAMNKVNELKSFIEEEEIDLAFISESHDRENRKLEDNIGLENHVVISNIHQREGKGGRPALIVNISKYDVQNLTNSVIQVTWGVK